MNTYYNTPKQHASVHVDESIHNGTQFTLEEEPIIKKNAETLYMKTPQTQTENKPTYKEPNATPYGLDAVERSINNDLIKPVPDQSTNNELLFNWDSTYAAQQMEQYQLHTQTRKFSLP